MKKTFLLTITLLKLLVGFTQEQKDYDLIIVIDESVKTSVANLTITVENSEGDFSIFPRYHAGSLRMSQSIFDKIISEDTKSVKITFMTNYFFKGKLNQRFYEIPYNKHWLKEDFNVLTIYNLTKAKYRKKYSPVDQSKNYSFSIDFGWYSILNLKK
ncbi:MAG: hypothetical protein CVU07_11070 [Bacteroidetes bacterium HGW-Bacteroidetes-23]|nr:MAG: hypothetical protein CVU07_11070 [Bacteroidetes bacterium HGW-Bacteroidetes-23]